MAKKYERTLAKSETLNKIFPNSDFNFDDNFRIKKIWRDTEFVEFLFSYF